MKTPEKDERFKIDEKKIKDEARYDGKWVLRTDMDIPAGEVALKYKQLWMVEQIFRSMKSILETRPVYHKTDETIRGHVFCSFLALVIMKELYDRLDAKEIDIEWERFRNDLDNLEKAEVDLQGKRFILRSATQGNVGKAFQAVGVALPPTVREVNLK